MNRSAKTLKVITQHSNIPVMKPVQSVYSPFHPIGITLLGFLAVTGMAYTRYVKFEKEKIYKMYDEYGVPGSHNYYVNSESTK
ncbi:hypothetical protein QEN19_000904 [Hanseniaspora menglaensis]